MLPVVSTSTLCRDADRVPIMVNPKAGSIAAQPGADRLASLLEKRGYKVEVFTDLAAATAQANRWHADGSLRTLVGVGGDGTAAELVNRTDDGLPLTLFPGGNSNLLARYLGMSKDPEFLCRTIVDGSPPRSTPAWPTAGFSSNDRLRLRRRSGQQRPCQSHRPHQPQKLLPAGR